MDKNMHNSLSLNHSFCCLLSPIHFAAGSCRENDSFQFLSPFVFTVGWQKKNVVKECSQFFSSCCLPCLSFISFFHSYMSSLRRQIVFVCLVELPSCTFCKVFGKSRYHKDLKILPMHFSLLIQVCVMVLEH